MSVAPLSSAADQATATKAPLAVTDTFALVRPGTPSDKGAASRAASAATDITPASASPVIQYFVMMLLISPEGGASPAPTGCIGAPTQMYIKTSTARRPERPGDRRRS